MSRKALCTLAFVAALTVGSGSALASGEPSLAQVAASHGLLLSPETGAELLPGASGGKYEVLFLAEITAMAQTSGIGVFEGGDPSSALVLFPGPVGPGGMVTLDAPPSGLGFLIQPGWYPGKTWWSQTAWNTDGFDHIQIYETQNDGQYIVGFEDLVNGGDQDYQDQVLLVTFKCDDGDGDGICDYDDNCPNDSNAGQADADGDGAGDVCDPCPADAPDDTDGDGVCESTDNCVDAPNSGQSDADVDGIGDACDACPTDGANDADGDGVCGDQDNCPAAANGDQGDADGDGVGDVCDACPADADNDADADGVCGDVDSCPDAANAGQEDLDLDGAGDACDACPADADDDADGDGACGDVDNCLGLANVDQADTDGDGVGDACDPCPLDAVDDPDGNGVCGYQPTWAFPGEISFAEAYNRVYSTGYSTWDSTGLTALLTDHGIPTPSTWSAHEVARIQVLVFDSSATHSLSLSAGGKLIPVFNPGPWTPPSRGWQPDNGAPILDVAALLQGAGLSASTPFSFVLGGNIVLNASNSHVVEGLEPGEWLIGYNDGGVNAGDADANEPIIHLLPALPDPEPTLECPAGYNLIEGTPGDDVLNGTSGDDCIYGYGGNDTIVGRAGNDILVGGAGNDVIRGGAGDDQIVGGSGDDTIRGGAGDDLVWGNAGADTLRGEHGNDMIDGGPGGDLLVGGVGDDLLAGGDGNDELRGHRGADVLYGGCGDDFVRGGRDDDILYGDDVNDLEGNLGDCPDGNDHIRGWRGNDLIYGGGGADLLRGGRGNDVVEGGDGDDRMYGGDDDDHLDGGDGVDVLNGGAKIDVCIFGETVIHCEGGGSGAQATGQATQVVWWRQGLRKNGTPVLAARSNPLEALDYDPADVDSNFFSLGFGGSIIVGFDGPVVNGPGADVQIFEKTYCCSPYPPEMVDVYAWDAASASWVWIGTATSDPGSVSDTSTELDLGALPSTWAIMIVDVSNPGPFASDGDGFDVNGVYAL